MTLSLVVRALFATLIGAQVSLVRAFDNTRYWGQNSYGAANSGDAANFQKPLAFYCQDDAIDVFPLAFLNVFFGTGGEPSINLANVCNPTDNATFSGTNLPNCASVGTDIKTCQSKGKIVTMSLGGATGSVGFSSDSQGETFADTVWNLFLGGTSSIRPFGDAVLDGVDLDIEGGTSTGYAAFVNRIRSHASGASKQYYVTAAPQCVYPDASLGGVLNAASFDAIYVQFYNNPCGLQAFDSASGWDFGLWDNWARTISPNPNVKVYVGAPASSTAAGTGYEPIGTLSSIAVQMRQSFPSFGGVMLWDASQAYANGRYDLAIKNALSAAGGTGFTFPACSAAYASGSTYTAGQQASYQGGHLWTAKWWTEGDTPGGSAGAWTDDGACASAGPKQDATSRPRVGSRFFRV
ncbi:carbohydrate-binding module family 5 protein [Phlebiopsis gigantea 11061_1 CR5-6]|uniref:chitinase n=1 Tax=Phlebiopsis gigantea (strain 11061_1 CR5-6) TaxID=745531 RepID=A0A0C3PUR7_PHLG1|nr:carbohydrate-binding module family 5 protein [Phlebiopsis gigantea 11061_1 CR5-6]